MGVVVQESGFVRFDYEDQANPGNYKSVTMLIPELGNIFENNDPITLQSIGELMIPACNAEASVGGNYSIAPSYALVSILKPYVAVNVPIV